MTAQQHPATTDTPTETDADDQERTDGVDPGGGDHDQVLHRTRPTIKPTLVWILVTLVVGATIAFASLANIFGFADPAFAAIIGWAVVFLAFAIIVRLLVRMYLLTRMTYTLTETRICHEFSLWFKQRSREIPFDRVRGYESQQDRIQRAFGVGTVSVLTGGTNASLGYIELDNVPHPTTVREIIREQREIAVTDRERTDG